MKDLFWLQLEHENSVKGIEDITVDFASLSCLFYMTVQIGLDIYSTFT